MAKIILNNVANSDDLSTLNNNFDLIEDTLQDKVLYRDNPVGEPNTMETSLDMNANRILNLPTPISENEPARLKDLQDVLDAGGDTATTISFSPAQGVIATNVQAAIEEVALDVTSVQTNYATKMSLTASSGASLVGFQQAGTGAAVRDLQAKCRERVSAEDFFLAAEADSTGMIQRAIDAVEAAGGGTVELLGKTYYTSLPLRLPSLVIIEGKNTFATVIEKTTNTTGTGTALARFGTVTDSYVLDCIIQMIHEDNEYTVYSGLKNLRLQKTSYAASSIAIYAPRANHIAIEHVWALNCAIGYYTFDGWMNGLNDVTVQACNIGFQHANDGSGLGTGTSTTFTNCWVNFDNTVTEPGTGFSLYGLTYSNIISGGVDNGIRIDGAASYAYSFNACNGIAINGSGVENGKGEVLRASSSNISVTALRSIDMTGVAAGTNGTVFADASNITLTNCAFGATTSPGVMYDWVIQGGSTVIEINPQASPSGGDTFVGYGGGSSKTRITGAGITRTTSTGTASAIPSSGSSTVTLTAGTSGTITLSGAHNSIAWHRVGNQITLTGQLFVDSVSAPVGALKIIGACPVAAGAAVNKYAAVSVTCFGLTAGATTAMVGRILPGTSDIAIDSYSAGGLNNAAGFVQASSAIIVSATYIVD